MNRLIHLAALLLLVLSPAMAQDTPPAKESLPPGLPPWTVEEERKKTGTDALSEELPDYDDLRLETGTPTVLQDRFLQSLPVFADDTMTTGLIFAEVDPAEPFAHMQLQELVAVALNSNFTLQNTRRSVLVARSNTRSSEAQFIPLVDLFGDARKTWDRDRNVPVTSTPTSPFDIPTTQERTNRTDGYTVSGGVDVTQNLQSGGRLTTRFEESTSKSDSSIADTRSSSRDYQGRFDVRYAQPLLRGAGFDVGTADLRRTRLNEMDTILGEQLQERDIVLQVIQAYFQLAATKQQIQVSVDAIRERRRFLEENRLKYEVGRVAESEILRAEIQYLQEIETAINRRQQLDSQRERLLLILGLPLDTPISFVDVTPTLLNTGRVDIPPVQEAVSEALATRPELIRADISISLSEIDHRVARNQMLPQLDFDAGYNRREGGPERDDAWEFDDSGWDAGVALRIPLINIQRRETLRRSVLSLESRETDRLSLERNIIQEVISSHRAVLAREATLVILQKTVEQARKNLQLINGSYEVGFSSVTDVRLAQDDLFAAETRYSGALLNYQVDLANLYVAMGRPLH